MEKIIESFMKGIMISQLIMIIIAIVMMFQGIFDTGFYTFSASLLGFVLIYFNLDEPKSKYHK